MKTFEKRKKSISRNLKIILLLVVTQWISGAGTAWSFASKFGFNVHTDITEDALERSFFNPFAFSVSLSNGEKIVFSSNAIDEIIEANRASDDGKFFEEERRHFDNETLIDGSLFLIEMNENIIGHITKAQPDGKMARELLGHALHALQDYYSHTNWLEIGNTSINNDLGRGIHVAPPADSPCPVFPALLGNGGFTPFPNVGLTEVTSGYYIAPLCDPVIRGGTNRCIHGSILICDGLHKDFIGRDGYSDAKNLAIEATKDFVQQIIDDINADSNIQNKDKAIRILLDQETVFQFSLCGKNVHFGVGSDLGFLSYQPGDFKFPAIEGTTSHPELMRIQIIDQDQGGNVVDIPGVNSETEDAGLLFPANAPNAGGDLEDYFADGMWTFPFITERSNGQPYNKDLNTTGFRIRIEVDYSLINFNEEVPFTNVIFPLPFGGSPPFGGGDDDFERNVLIGDYYWKQDNFVDSSPVSLAGQSCP